MHLSSEVSEISPLDLDEFLEAMVQRSLAGRHVRRALLLPPDHSRFHSKAGEITQWLWNRLSPAIDVDVMPTVGTHRPMNPEQIRRMFGECIPLDRFIQHRWREDTQVVGQLSPEALRSLSGGQFADSVEVAVNRKIISSEYDLILSIGQVVPHEVIGFANYTKNVCIGVGGRDIVHKSHFLGAVCNMETIMGRADTPVRRAVNAAFDRFIRPHASIEFLLTVVAQNQLRGVFCGRDDDCFLLAAKLSAQLNIIDVPTRFDRCAVYLDPEMYSSTWLGNKAIYRTRMAMADGGELFVLAPGVCSFGEDAEIDMLVRRHGYRGTTRILSAVDSDPELKKNLAAAAHLIHGSSEGRFRITYCPGRDLSRDEIEGVGYAYMPYEAAAARFLSGNHRDGVQRDATGREFLLIRDPGQGLWRGWA